MTSRDPPPGAPRPPGASGAPGKPARSWPLSRKTIVTRAVALAVAGLAIYLLLPSLTRVLASWPRLRTLDPVWLAVALVAEVASFTCTFALQRLALQTRAWFSVVTAGLAGNGVSGILPGGAAAGAGLQFEMLSNAGFDSGTAAAALTAFSLLEVGAAGAPRGRAARRAGRHGRQPRARADRAAGTRDVLPACRRWRCPAEYRPTRSWPRWPTGSPPTGFRCPPGCPPTSCTGTATAAWHTTPGIDSAGRPLNSRRSGVRWSRLAGCRRAGAGLWIGGCG